MSDPNLKLLEDIFFRLKLELSQDQISYSSNLDIEKVEKISYFK